MKRARGVFACGAALVACCGIYALGVNASPAPTYRGDQVGMELGESSQAYKARVEPQLRESSQKAWALVTFAQEEDFEEAARIVNPALRVSAVVVTGAPPRDIPEPVPGEDRADVFEREAGRVRVLASENGVDLDAETASGAVVWDTGDNLRKIAADEAVFTVEVLPADATWGTFGISPVVPRPK